MSFLHFCVKAAFLFGSISISFCQEFSLKKSQTTDKYAVSEALFDNKYISVKTPEIKRI